ncbi:MAG: hypothetical protein Kow00114_40720 [Kiloniellaceae bacterium]
MTTKTLTRIPLAFALALMLSGWLPATPAFAADRLHKVAVHVDDNDPQRINMALNNVQNLKAFYDSAGQQVEIEVVAYGPGLHMLRSDTSPVKDRISAMALEIEGLTFSACANTLSGMTKNEGKQIELVSESHLVPSGVVRLVELQEDGYAYVRP